MTELPVSQIRVNDRCRKDLGDIEALARSIATVGLLHALPVTTNGLLVAGERRLAAVKQLGWTNVSVHVIHNIEDLLLLAERDENTCREPLPPAAAARLAAKIAAMLAPKAEEAQRKGKSADGKAGGRGRKKNLGAKKPKDKRESKTADKAAAAAGMSASTLRKVAEVQALAAEHPELLKPMLAALEKPGAKVDRIKKAATTLVQKAATEEAAAKIAKLPGGVRLEVARMEDLLPTLHGLDAIVTDPPYSAEHVALYGTLAKLAAKALGPHGILAVMCGQSYLPDILATMTPHIAYRWTMAYLTPGGQAVQLWQRKVNTFWKPVLLFGAQPSRWTGDVVRSDTNDNDKRFHEWGQSESGMARLVEALTEPGQTICDPFLGAGTTAVVALATGRRFIGCDIDREAVTLARGRVAQLLESAG